MGQFFFNLMKLTHLLASFYFYLTLLTNELCSELILRIGHKGMQLCDLYEASKGKET
jgi:hypothetical protein